MSSIDETNEEEKIVGGEGEEPETSVVPEIQPDPETSEMKGGKSNKSSKNGKLRAMGSRSSVYNGFAKHTSGGLTRKT